MKRVLIACDKFKGSLSASEACNAIAKGLRGQRPELEIELCAMADGGEGMSFIITETQQGKLFQKRVTGPMGTPIQATYGLINHGKTAVIEMAQASGLDRLSANQTNDPWQATTFGTGELTLDAIERGATHLILGIGGSATNDGGTGMAQALGYRFIGRDENSSMPADLLNITKILPPVSPLSLESVEVACDVTNPVLGDNGCTRIYGPQKGIKSSEFESHEARLSHLISLTENGVQLANHAGAGAAGGLGFGCLAFLNATLTSGFDLIAQAVDLEQKIIQSDMVITGEGQIDQQSEQGKVPFGVSQLAKKHSKPTFAFCGKNDATPDQTLFNSIFEIDRQNHPIDEAIKNAANLLEMTASKVKIF